MVKAGIDPAFFVSRLIPSDAPSIHQLDEGNARV
jgi:hypothetical protein